MVAKKNEGLPVIAVNIASLQKQEHDKYGVSYILEGNSVMIDGKLFKINTFKVFKEAVVEGHKVKVPVTSIAFRPVEGATVPKAPKETFKTAETPKVTSESARIDKLEAALSQILAAVAAK